VCALVCVCDATMLSYDDGWVYGRCMSARQDGSTSLMVACHNGRLDVARWLVAEKGCDVNAKNTVGVDLWQRVQH
jgi:hypothetical protein